MKTLTNIVLAATLALAAHATIAPPASAANYTQPKAEPSQVYVHQDPAAEQCLSGLVCLVKYSPKDPVKKSPLEEGPIVGGGGYGGGVRGGGVGVGSKAPSASYASPKATGYSNPANMTPGHLGSHVQNFGGYVTNGPSLLKAYRSGNPTTFAQALAKYSRNTKGDLAGISKTIFEHHAGQ